jgi:diacylglycerol kinase
MFGLFDSVVDLVSDVAKVVIAPVEIAVDLAGAAVKPLAEVAKDLANEVKSLKD